MPLGKGNQIYYKWGYNNGNEKKFFELFLDVYYEPVNMQNQ